MKLGKYILLILIAVSVQATTVERSKQEKLQELVNLMNMDSIVDTMYSQVEQMIQSTAQQLEIQPSEQTLFETYSREVSQLLRDNFSWTHMEPHMMEIYNRNFTEEEVDDLLAFYKTKTGQSMIAKMPIIVQESMHSSQLLMQDALPLIQKMSADFAEKLKKSRSLN